MSEQLASNARRTQVGLGRLVAGDLSVQVMPMEWPKVWLYGQLGLMLRSLLKLRGISWSD